MLTKDLIRDNYRTPGSLKVRDIYDLLLESPHSELAQRESRRFLQEQLIWVRQCPHNLPADPARLEHWMEQHAFDAGERYAEYLHQRREGAPRKYFPNRACALAFLQQVAPTKLVDGAWLYGTLPHWNDIRFMGLVRTYLEELGEGDPDQNHVVLYRRLLAENDCDTLPEFSDEHYVRGAIQLALAHNADDFLPEVVGYNLGYEQLPLHLLITAFELAELNLDPYYFTLHITIDNTSTGHARKAAQAVQACMPVAGDKKEFWQRVINGYRLSELGLGVDDITRGFNLEHELVAMLERKRPYGQNIHSDFCSIGGRTVNQWLSAPGQAQQLLNILQEKRWIIRHQNPELSRFWRLIESPQAPMAGVFDGYEKQLLHDWIAGDHLTQKYPPKRRNFRRYPKRNRTNHPTPLCTFATSGDAHQDARYLERELLALPQEQRMQHLINYMCPSKHTGPAGLFATREFVSVFNGQAGMG